MVTWYTAIRPRRGEATGFEDTWRPVIGREEAVPRAQGGLEREFSCCPRERDLGLLPREREREGERREDDLYRILGIGSGRPDRVLMVGYESRSRSGSRSGSSLDMPSWVGLGPD
ncbi:hypothetical protein AMTR_s00148p00063000 [Amborella trichopoda]|uniref:Uncharacterized protein n=1 Tax=Amborella trichopoda TaxID=13333 RepID=W1PKU6_AMBTC|nr:hypothetical protein AMTR_s00148p00063000 [Amborella trichopoda]